MGKGEEEFVDKAEVKRWGLFTLKLSPKFIYTIVTENKLHNAHRFPIIPPVPKWLTPPQLFGNF